MSQLLGAVLKKNTKKDLTQNKIDMYRLGFTLPHLDNNSNSEDIEPNVQSSKKIELQLPERSDFKGDCLSPDPDLEEESRMMIVLETKQKVNLWVHGGLRIMFYITKFVKQMKTHSTEVKFKSLTNEILALISDSASDVHVLLHKFNKIHQFIQNLKWIMDFIPVLDPDSNYKIIWDIFVLIQIIINVFYIPLKLGFDFEKEDAFTNVFLESLPSWTFVLDIIITFFTAYYNKGQIHRNKEEILKNYISFQFWWDLMIVIPFILSSYSVPYTEYILLLRVTKVKSMIETIEEVTNPSMTVQTLLELFKSIFQILFVSHFCACIWNLIGEIEENQGQISWLSAQEITDSTWSTKYIHAFYFSTITTLTIGYGDITPQTDFERMYVIVMAMVICGLFGYTISSIGNILRQLGEKEQIFKQNMMYINNFLKKKNLSKQLQLSVRKYFEYYLKMEQDYNEYGEKMMNVLNKNLKEQVAIDIYYNMLMKSRLIKHTLSQKSVYKLCQFVHEKKCAPEDVIALQNDQADKLIFLQTGELNLICDQKLRETKLATIEEGKFVGEREFIIQGRYDYMIRTAKFSQIAYINYEDFLRIVREDALEEENYCMLRDEMLFSLEKQNYGEVCYICKWTHQFKKCPLVFVSFNFDRIRKKFMMSEDMNRLKYDRRLQKKHFLNSLIREHVIALIVNENMIAIEDLTDQFLDTLGFNLDDDQSGRLIKTLKSQKSNKSYQKGFTGFDQFSSDDSDSSSVSGNQNVKTKTGKSSKYNAQPSMDQKKVKFQQSPEPEPRILRQQNSFKRKVDNRHRTFQRLTQISNNRFTNITNFSQDQIQQPSLLSSVHQNTQQTGTTQKRILKNNSTSYSNMDVEMAPKSFSKLDAVSSNMINQLEDISTQKLTRFNDQQQERIDFDIDRNFITTSYFTQHNLDKVIQKVQRATKKATRVDQIQSLIRKSKIFKPSQFGNLTPLTPSSQ